MVSGFFDSLESSYPNDGLQRRGSRNLNKEGTEPVPQTRFVLLKESIKVLCNKERRLLLFPFSFRKNH